MFLWSNIVKTGKYPFYETQNDRQRKIEKNTIEKQNKKIQEGIIQNTHMLYNKRLKQMVRM